MNLFRSTWPFALMLAGCAVTVAPVVAPAGDDAKVAPKKAPAKAAPASAAPSKASEPSTAPVAVAATTAPGAKASAKPTGLAAIALPRKILPPLPPSLLAAAGGLIGNDGGTLVADDGGTLIGNDGGTLIGNDGGTLIGNDGGTLIGNDGGTLIGNDGGTYRLVQAPEAMPTCGPVLLPPEPKKLIQMEVQDFLANCTLIEGFLADAAKIGLRFGQARVVKRVHDGESRTFAFLLEPHPQGPGGVLYVGSGREVTRTKYVVAVAFRSKDEGEAIYRIEDLKGLLEAADPAAALGVTGGVAGVRVAFDLTKGHVTSDTASRVETTFGIPLVVRRQVDVQRLASDGPEAPNLRLAIGMMTTPSQDAGCAEERRSMAVHYLPDERAAVQVARANMPGQPLAFVGTGGVREAEPTQRTGVLVDKDGTLLESSTTPALMLAILPGKELMPAVPTLIERPDVLADPLFSFD